MPRYFFTLRDGDLFPDEEGQELDGPEAARANAITAAREMMGEGIRQGRLSLRDIIIVTDNYGHEVMKVTFRESVRIEQ